MNRMPSSQFPKEQNTDGSFNRQHDAFRDVVTTDGSSPYTAEPGRYHLYVSLACPWAHRTLIVRNLRALQDLIGISIADPERDNRGWAFRPGPGHGRDECNGFHFLEEAYRKTDPEYSGRVTVPALWDRRTSRIVNNSEDDICRFLNDSFRTFGDPKVNFFPQDISKEHNEICGVIHDEICNGVYEAGFATRQKPYEYAVKRLFQALDQMEQFLGDGPYLFGSRIVEADLRLFCTLIRFDAVYHGHFKCNLRRISDYPNLQSWLERLYAHPGVAQTVNLDHIKRHYYRTHDEINPTRIVPLGPELPWIRNRQ